MSSAPPQVPPDTSPSISDATTQTSFTPTRLLRKLRDLDLGNVEATPHVELRIASPLPPPTLEDVHPQAQPPGDLSSLAYPFSGAYTLETQLHIRPTQSYIDVLASTTPTTQYRTVPHSSLTSLRLRDLPGPPRNPLKGHHLVVQTLLGHSRPQSRFP
ncbi:hypothetical protein F5877DRAFT_85773 [Lentinula edodes]|nr:hypothetical protein F5877DRAFT_85773 [Lentinula edodes]